jgi:hypothetical protein
VHVGPDSLHVHPFHKLKGDIGSAGFLHAGHGGTKNNDILGYVSFSHFVKVFEALSPLVSLFTGGYRAAVRDDGDCHVLELHFIKQIESSLPLERLVNGLKVSVRALKYKVNGENCIFRQYLPEDPSREQSW